MFDDKRLGRFSSLPVAVFPESDVSSSESAGATANDREWPGSSDRPRVHLWFEEFLELLDKVSGKTGAVCFTLCRTRSRKSIHCLRFRSLAIRTEPRLTDCHIRDRRKVANEMVARLAPSYRRRSRGMSERVGNWIGT